MRKHRKLKLNRETLRQLDRQTLGEAQGASGRPQCVISVSQCQACPVTFGAGCVYTLQPGTECESFQCPPEL